MQKRSGLIFKYLVTRILKENKEKSVYHVTENPKEDPTSLNLRDGSATDNLGSDSITDGSRENSVTEEPKYWAFNLKNLKRTKNIRT